MSWEVLWLGTWYACIKKITACCWWDGANVQLNTIVWEEQQKLDGINRIITCKHNTRRAVIEQSCGTGTGTGTGTIFISNNAISKSITKNNSPHMGLKQIMYNLFKKFDQNGSLCLSSTKKGSLIDFLLCYPNIISKAISHNSITSGFVDNGMIYCGSYMYPDLHRIFNTCKSKHYIKPCERVVKKCFNNKYIIIASTCVLISSSVNHCLTWFVVAQLKIYCQILDQIDQNVCGVLILVCMVQLRSACS